MEYMFIGILMFGIFAIARGSYLNGYYRGFRDGANQTHAPGEGNW